MKKKYTNQNTKVTDIQIRAIMSQIDWIDDQIQILVKSKKAIFDYYGISKANYYLRKKNLISKTENNT